MPTVGEKAFHDLCDTLERLPWPNPLIGKPEDAEQQLIAAVDKWILLRQPVMGDAKTLREIDLQEREARFRLAEAAAFWAYFKRDPYLVAHPALAAAAREGGDVKQAPAESPQSGGEAVTPNLNSHRKGVNDERY